MRSFLLGLVPLVATALAAPSPTQPTVATPKSSDEYWGPDLSNQPLPSLVSPSVDGIGAIQTAPPEVHSFHLAFDPRVRHRQASICQSPGVCPMNVSLDCSREAARRMQLIEFEHPQGRVQFKVLPGKKYCDGGVEWTDPAIFDEMAVAFNGSYRVNVPKQCYVDKEKMGYAADTYGQIAYCHWPETDNRKWHGDDA